MEGVEVAVCCVGARVARTLGSEAVVLRGPGEAGRNRDDQADYPDSARGEAKDSLGVALASGLDRGANDWRRPFGQSSGESDALVAILVALVNDQRLLGLRKALALNNEVMLAGVDGDRRSIEPLCERRTVHRRAGADVVARGVLHDEDERRQGLVHVVEPRRAVLAHRARAARRDAQSELLACS
jgi:hypothetical protein